MDFLKQYGKWIGLVAIVLVVGLAFFQGTTKDEAKKAEEEKQKMLSSTQDPSRSQNSNSTGGSSEEEGIPEDGVTPALVLENYKEWAQYPPYSRPMSLLNYDLAFPFLVENSPEYLTDPISKEPNGYVCLFQPKTWAVIGPKDSIYITLECRDKDRNRAKISIDSHQMYREWEGKRIGTVSADVGDNGTDGDQTRGDNVYTFAWKPSKSDWGQMSLEAEITYGPQNTKTKLKTTFFSSPNIPAEFPGIFTESIQDGSLSVKAVVQVYRKGRYHLEANLKDEKNGEYISYATFDGELKAGANDVEFIFFGKILRDKDLDGPYQVTAFRGHRVNLPIDPEWFSQGDEGLRKIQAAKTTEPDRELVYPFKEEYKTKSYKVESFSKAAWDSQEKQDRIRLLSSIQ